MRRGTERTLPFQEACGTPEASGDRRSGQNWKLVVAYDGSDFKGWQVQPGLPTVQGHLSDAIEHVTSERVLPQGSGRTDAGVHALGQVASFALRASIPAANLQRALNRSLPASVRILSAEPAPPNFHARHSAVGKTYEYRIFREELCPPWLARYVYSLSWPLNLEAMYQAAESVLGEHDFTSFAAYDPDASSRQVFFQVEVETESSLAQSAPANCIRRIHESSWRTDGSVLSYRVRGSGFLHHMVRNLVGTFLDVGRGHYPPEAIPAMLQAKSRSAAGATAPARGLFLVGVDYPEE